MSHEPFYFKSYERVVGVAHDLKELVREMDRLAKEDRGCVEYHLKEGHISAWLDYIGEKTLAKELRRVKSVEEAIDLLRAHLTANAIPPATAYLTGKKKRSSNERAGEGRARASARAV